MPKNVYKNISIWNLKKKEIQTVFMNIIKRVIFVTAKKT